MFAYSAGVSPDDFRCAISPNAMPPTASSGNNRLTPTALTICRPAATIMGDGSSGLDAVNELLRVFEVPVVFITAYPERFLTGERPEPAFLISKPFQPAMVSAVASQALFFQRNSRNRAAKAAAS